MSQIAEAFVRVRYDTDTASRSRLNQTVGRDLRGVERQLQSTNREFSRFSRGALVGTGALHQLGRAAAFASLSFIGGAGLIVGIKSTIAAAMEAQAALAQTENSVERAGVSWERYGKQIQDAALLQSQLSGLDDERFLRTFSLLLRSTGDVNRALKDNALAANIARGANIQLEQAAKIVARAEAGQARGLAQLGIVLEKGATRMQILTALTEKYAGSTARFADTAAGAQARFSVAINETQEAIGTALLPTVTRYLNKGTEWLNQAENQERIQRSVNEAVRVGTQVLSGLSDALGVVRSIAEPVVDVLGGLKTTVELLLIAMVARRVAEFATALGLVGPAGYRAAAGITAAQTAAARGGLGGAALRGAGGPIGLALGGTVLLDQLVNPNGNGTSQYGSIDELRNAAAKGGDGGIASELLQKVQSQMGGTLTVADVYQALSAGVLTPSGVTQLRDRFATLQHYNIALRLATSVAGKKKSDVAAIVGATTAGNAAGSRGSSGYGADAVTRDQATATALAKAQASGDQAAIVAAVNARRSFVADTIAFANKLVAEGRGDTAKLQSTLQSFYGEDEALQGVLAGFVSGVGASGGSGGIADTAQDIVDAANRKAEEWRRSNHDIQEAFEAARKQGREFHEAFAARVREDAERQLALQDQLLENAVSRARLIPDADKALAAEKRADRKIVEVLQDRVTALKRQKAGILAVERAKSDVYAAQLTLRSLNDRNAKIGGGDGFSLQDLFTEATSQFAQYGSNIGGGPLSAQDARGAFAGTVKTHQTTVVQNFYGERGAGQALADAARVAKNMKD